MEKKPVVEEFLESHNMDYLFLLLANLEVNRLSELPYSVKKKISKKNNWDGNRKRSQEPRPGFHLRSRRFDWPRRRLVYF